MLSDQFIGEKKQYVSIKGFLLLISFKNFGEIPIDFILLVFINRLRTHDIFLIFPFDLFVQIF